MIAVATSPNPPLRLQLGSDYVARVETKLSQVAHELAQWRALASSTDHAAARGSERAGMPA
jgi:hypothetical protein